MKKFTLQPLVITAFLAGLNIIGAQIALVLKLPIYLDSIGTMVAAFLFGPLYGGLCGLVGNLITGFLFDSYSLFFAPSAVLLGILPGWPIVGVFYAESEKSLGS